MHVAVLNSRQSKTPINTDPWVENTLAALEACAGREDIRVVSSVGMVTWNLVTWRAGQLGIPMDLVAPPDRNGSMIDRARSILTDLDLDESRVRWNVLPTPVDDLQSKLWWKDRDARVVELADRIVPVSVRNGGHLASLVTQIGDNRIVDQRFETPYSPQPHHNRFLVDQNRLSPEIRDWSGEYLIHWTRSCHGPWPGETTAQFLNDLTHSPDGYCRSADATLNRILTERLIRGSSWRIGGGERVVALTDLSPLDSIPIMRWRSRWARWTFEPYGIAIRKDLAIARGAHPVRYVDGDRYRHLSAEERPYAHSRGEPGHDWPAEREWRFPGDVDINDIPSDAMCVLVRSRREVDTLQQLRTSPVTPFMED